LPKVRKLTDIGMTVGCLKAFPEKPNQILPILKEAGLDAAFPDLKECDALFNPEKKFC